MKIAEQKRCFYKFSLILLFLAVALIAIPSKAQPTGAMPALSDEDQLQWNTLSLIANDMQNGDDNDAKKKASLEYLHKSEGFVASHPDYFEAWVLRAKASLIVNNVKCGVKAAAKLKALGALRIKDANIVNLMATLNRHGWLDEQRFNKDTGTILAGDDVEALEMLADDGNVAALNRLATIYMKGIGVSVNYSEAVHDTLIVFSIKRNDPIANRHYAELILLGAVQLDPKGDVRATAWHYYKIAAVNGDSVSQDWLDNYR
jgi:hypothetical protein